VQIDLDDATSLGVVITELVNNAYLHAFPEGQGEITVRLEAGPDRLVLLVGDNGTGFVAGETKRRGVGLVRRLVEQVGATLDLQSDRGTLWTATLAIGQDVPLELV